MTFSGKVVLVTGGAQGIGRAIVEGFLKSGSKVSFLDKNKEVALKTLNELESSCGKDELVFHHCDVGNLEQLEECFSKTVEKFGHLDIVVNNAGIINESHPGWIDCVNVNVKAVVRGTELGIKHMSKSNGKSGGCIINTSSMAALDTFAPVPVYSATKAFINQFTRCHGTEEHFKRTGVKVMAILPGITETPMIHHSPSVVVQELRELWNEINDCLVPQKASNLSNAVETIIEKGENGSLWIVSDDRPPSKVQLQYKI